MIQMIDPSTCHITLTQTNAAQCSSMPWSKSRMRLTQPFHSDAAAVKESVVLALWTSMVVTTWPAFVVFQKITPKNPLFHHLCSCLYLRILLLTWVISMLSTNQLTHSSSVSPRKLKVNVSTFRVLGIESCSMASMNAFSVLAVSQPARLIGGILRTILVQLY